MDRPTRRIESLRDRIKDWDDGELTDIGMDFRVLIEYIEHLENLTPPHQ